MNSDPGTSGLLSPFAKINGLYFNSEDEVSDFYYNLVQDLKRIYKDKGKVYITCEYDNPKDFYDALTNMQKYLDEGLDISGTSREGVYEMVINEDSDMDDHTKPQTVALAKKKKKKKDPEVEITVE